MQPNLYLLVAVHTSVFARLLPSGVSKQRQRCMSVKYNRDPFQLRWLKSTLVHVTHRFVIVVPILREMKLDFLRKDDWLNWVKMVYFCFRALYFIYIFISNHFYFNRLTHSDKLIIYFLTYFQFSHTNRLTFRLGEAQSLNESVKIVIIVEIYDSIHHANLRAVDASNNSWMLHK